MDKHPAVRPPVARLLATLVVSQLLVSQSLQAQTLLTEPIQVLLHWRAIDGSENNPQKLGIYVSIGDSPSPQIFEFDTGGAGFFSTYSSGAASPWWGSTGWTGTTTPVSNAYGSGLQYDGVAVSGTVNLFNSAAELTPRLRVDNVVIAQTNTIVDTRTNETLWPPPSGSSICPAKPPTECAFYGDFGMALKTGKSGSVDSLVRQPSFWAAFDQTLITPGYRVHAPLGGRPWVQFGLGADDLAAQAGSFQLDLKTGLVSGALTVSKGAITFPVDSPPSAPLLFDTGAFPTIHAEECKDNPNPPDFPRDLTLGQACQSVSDGAQVVVSGLTTGLQLEPFWSFDAGSGASQVNLALKVKDKNKDGYYLNTGLFPFYDHDIIFNLDTSNPQLTLVSVPGPAPIVGAFSAFGVARRLRRRIGRS
jgi:hypothetical protein